MLKTDRTRAFFKLEAYHLGEGRVLKTSDNTVSAIASAYHLGEGRVLKTLF